MKLTVNFEDRTLVLDGVAVVADQRLTPPNVNSRVIQWLGQSGWIEVYQGNRVWLSSETSVAPYVQLYNTLVAEAQAAQEARLAAELAARAEAQGNSGE